MTGDVHQAPPDNSPPSIGETFPQLLTRNTTQFKRRDAMSENAGVTILLAEQNTNIALRYATHGDVLESERIVLAGAAEALRNNSGMKEFCLGLGSKAASAM